MWFYVQNHLKAQLEVSPSLTASVSIGLSKSPVSLGKGFCKALLLQIHSWGMALWSFPSATPLQGQWFHEAPFPHSALEVCLVHFICQMTIFVKTKSLSPSTSKSHPWGMALVTERTPIRYVFTSFICENTRKVWHKSHWHWLVIEI